MEFLNEVAQVLYLVVARVLRRTEPDKNKFKTFWLHEGFSSFIKISMGKQGKSKKLFLIG